MSRWSDCLRFLTGCLGGRQLRIGPSAKTTAKWCFDWRNERKLARKAPPPESIRAEDRVMRPEITTDASNLTTMIAAGFILAARHQAQVITAGGGA